MLSVTNPSSFLFSIVLFIMLLIFTGLPAISILADETVQNESMQQKNPFANSEITIKIIPAVNNTFGYDILISGRPLVH